MPREDLSHPSLPFAEMSNPATSEPASTTADSERNDVTMHSGLSSSQTTSSEDVLALVYPNLGPAPQRWRDDLKDLLDHLDRTYLMDPETNLAQ
jgi:hypothetical protein